MPSVTEPPVMAEIWRGDAVESRHRGEAVVADSAGRVVASWGDADALIYPRSAIKALQALPLIETGAFDAFGLSAPMLALACASHHGEAFHLALAEAWLRRLDVGSGSLACGPHPPLDEDAAEDLIRSGCFPTALHNNCSGKHLGMLTTARHRGEPLENYIHPDHPVQRRILDALETMTGTVMARTSLAVDGCGAPAPRLSLRGLAVAMARMADPSGLAPCRSVAIQRIREAWACYPEMIGGTTSTDSRLIQAAGGAVLVKSGAEGVAVAVLMRQKLGLVLKIEDGTPRAKTVALVALLGYLGAIDGNGTPTLAKLALPEITNWAGRIVGRIRPGAGWLEGSLDKNTGRGA